MSISRKRGPRCSASHCLSVLTKAVTSSAGMSAGPESLRDLLVDTRGSSPRHHLRQLYADPFTMQADWDLLRDGQGRVVAVASRSRRAAMSRPQLGLRPGANPAKPAVGDWVFEAHADSVQPEPPTSSTSRIERARRP